MVNDNEKIPKKRRRLRISHLLIILLVAGVGFFVYYRLSLKSKLGARIDALELLHAGASIEHCRYPIDLSAGFETKLSPLSEIRKAAFLLKLESGFVVYSIGEDLNDDGGKEKPTGKKKKDETWDVTFIIER